LQILEVVGQAEPTLRENCTLRIKLLLESYGIEPFASVRDNIRRLHHQHGPELFNSFPDLLLALNNDRDPYAYLPAVLDPLASCSGSALDIAEHIEHSVQALTSLAKAVVLCRETGGDLGEQPVRVIYLLANHIAKLHRQVKSVNYRRIATIRTVLARFKIQNWTPTERISWCRGCGHTPLYTLIHPTCENCGWMRCPACGVCKLAGNCCSPAAGEGTRSVNLGSNTG
jgi:hypothetical protein